MTDPDDLPSEYPVLATLLTAALGAVGYVLPTAIFGRPVQPLPTVAFAGGFAIIYIGAKLLRERFPELQ